MKRKKVMAAIAVLFIALSLIAVALFYAGQKLAPGDVEFAALEWSKGTNWDETCSRCGSQNCTAKVDSILFFRTLDEIRGRNAQSYIQCVEIIDGVDRYRTKSASLTIPKENYTTFNSLDPMKPHTVEVCCGLILECESDSLVLQIQGYVRNLMGLTETNYYQVCKAMAIGPACP